MNENDIILAIIHKLPVQQNIVPQGPVDIVGVELWNIVELGH